MLSGKRKRVELNPADLINSKIYAEKMSGFSGFTEADIRKVKNGQNLVKNTPENDKPKAPMKQKKLVIKDNKNHKYLSKLSPSNDLMPIPEEAKLVVSNLEKPNQTDSNNKNDVKTAQSENNSNQEKLKSEESITTNNKECRALVNDTKHVKEEANLSSKAELNSDKKIDLEEFQVKQKLMEEQNRRRKELLAKALEDRTKRTLEEQQRLNKIQDEFKKLDANLSNDVKILRKQIELASIDYMEAQKKYHRIEREFLDAKLYLHQKLERKEMLTEYLCAIIEKNEERKAEKLNELLEKLNVRDDESEQNCSNE